MIAALLPLVAAALVFTGGDATNAYECAGEMVAKLTPRDAGTARGRIAAYWLLDHAAAAGADARLDIFAAPTPKGKRQLANVIGEFVVDPEKPWVVLVSHYDTKSGIECPGANDGASTSGLLLALCRALKRAEPLALNVMLIWTDAEECMGPHYVAGDGFQGSKRAAEMLRRRGLDVKAVICLDMLGDRELSIQIPRNVSDELATLAIASARACGLPADLVARREILVKDDHLSFFQAGFPSLLLIDFDYGSESGLNDYWHTAKDTMDRISADSLEKSGRLVAEIMKKLGV